MNAFSHPSKVHLKVCLSAKSGESFVSASWSKLLQGKFLLSSRAKGLISIVYLWVPWNYVIRLYSSKIYCLDCDDKFLGSIHSNYKVYWWKNGTLHWQYSKLITSLLNFWNGVKTYSVDRLALPVSLCTKMNLEAGMGSSLFGKHTCYVTFSIDN